MGLVSSIVLAVGAIGAAVVSSQGASKAAETQAEAQQAQIRADKSAAEKERIDRQAAITKEETIRQEAIARKEKAIADIKFPTFLEGPAAQKLQGTLEDRIAGRGLIDVDALTAPSAVQRRAGLEEQTLPIINSLASAKGLGRSTIPVAQGASESRAAERDIAERVSQLELVKQNQIQDAINQFENIVGREADSQERKAIFERGGEFDVANSIAGDAGIISQEQQALSASIKSNEFAIAELINQKGATEAAYQLKQAEIWASAIADATSSFSSSDTVDRLLDSIGKQEDKNKAQVNIGTTPAGYTGSRTGFDQWGQGYSF